MLKGERQATRVSAQAEVLAPALSPPAEKSLHRLHRSGWSCSEAGFTHPGGRYVHQVDGRNGENIIVGRGAIESEAWWRAIEAAAAVGMLAD
jgi:hypothetical protein